MTYEIDTTGLTSPFNIKVKLRYQTIKASFVFAIHADDELMAVS